jgi:hypothetical protein
MIQRCSILTKERKMKNPLSRRDFLKAAAGVMGANHNIYYGLGYCGHGVNSSFLFGNVIASTYNHVVSGWERTAYANEPLASMPPDIFKWLGVNGITTYYHLKDGK